MNIALTSLEQYLDTSHSPDREYVDGVVVERNLGERPHSQVQSNLVFFLRQRYPDLFVWPEQRVRTVAGQRSRVPDVCVTEEDPKINVFESPPLIVAEILSKRDEMGDVLEKLEEYAAFGVPHIWVIDPRRKKAFTYSGTRFEEVESGALTARHGVDLPLSDVFQGL
jgi:Uma2 family endonuclease